VKGGDGKKNGLDNYFEQLKNAGAQMGNPEDLEQPGGPSVFRGRSRKLGVRCSMWPKSELVFGSSNNPEGFSYWGISLLHHKKEQGWLLTLQLASWLTPLGLILLLQMTRTHDLKGLCKMLINKMLVLHTDKDAFVSEIVEAIRTCRENRRLIHVPLICIP